jgi:hypothetical protein
MAKIFIAITSYESKITTKCAEALLCNIETLKEAGHEVQTYFHSGDAYIARARNYCATIFLHTKFTDLVFIDCDVGFEKSDILKLFKHDLEVVAGVYPYRTDDPDIIGGKIPFPITLKFDLHTNNCLDEKTGLVSAFTVPMGFCRINRTVFKELIDKGSVSEDSHNLYNFFDTGSIFNAENTWYGEDTAFCRRWREIGGEIWVEPDINFIHQGIKEYKNNLHEYLSRKKKES